MSLVSENTCDRHAGTPHADYPHEPGYLESCYACTASTCHCDTDAVRQGRQTICVSSLHDFDRYSDDDMEGY